MTSSVSGGDFFIDVRNREMGGGMLLFLLMAIAQIIGGVIYESEPALPFYIMSVGIAIVAICGYFKVNNPKDLYA